LHLVGLTYQFILRMHGHTNINNLHVKFLTFFLTVVIPMCYTKLFKKYNFSQTQLFIVVNYAYGDMFQL